MLFIIKITYMRKKTKSEDLNRPVQTLICIIQFVLDNGKVELQRKSLLSFRWWSDALEYYFSNKAALFLEVY